MMNLPSDFKLTCKRVPNKINKNDFFKLFEYNMKKHFYEDGFLDPTVALLHMHGEIDIFQLDFSNVDYKNLSINLIKSFAKELNAIKCCSAMEIWMTEIDKDDSLGLQLVKDIGVTMMPNKKECIVMSFDSIETITMENVVFEVKKDNGMNTLIEVLRNKSSLQVEDNFLQILNKNLN